MKTINELTLYDLAGQDFSVWLTKNKADGYDLELTDEYGEEFSEKGLHNCAAASLAEFCRDYLFFYNKIQHKEMGN